MASDASSFAWGAVLDPDRRPYAIRDYWPPNQLDQHINVKETLALANALDAVAPMARGQHVDVYTDSQVLLKAWNRQGSKSQALFRALKTLFWVITRHGMHIRLLYVPSSQNVADPPSRALLLQDAKLSPSAWETVQDTFGPHSADLMAIPSNVQLDLLGHPLPFFHRTTCRGLGESMSSPNRQCGILNSSPTHTSSRRFASYHMCASFYKSMAFRSPYVCRTRALAATGGRLSRQRHLSLFC